jgi:capsular polysaccharide export protein
MSDAAGRHFLFLQGPHGPFARRLAAALAARGAAVSRVAFNAADEAEWREAGPLDAYTGPQGAYAAWLVRYLALHRVTDIVLYGDSRPVHAEAIAVAGPRGIRCHCFEEGYIRPRWITYERGGTNGNSPLNAVPLAAMARALDPGWVPPAAADDGWGAYRAHLWHSGLYHGRLMLPSRRYGPHRSARGIGLGRELANYMRRGAGLPLRRLGQGLAARRLLASGTPFHLALLQLSFDSSLQAHSGFAGAADFAVACIAAFAEGAPPGELLAFKSHPFDDGRDRLDRVIRDAAARECVAGRVLFLDGAPDLAPLLDGAKTVVTVNSTAAQPALLRGLPVAALGRAVYARPELVSPQPLAEFFAAPRRPDREAYRVFRRFLLETSQAEGSFYAGPGIARLCATLPDAMLAEDDPYRRLLGDLALPVPARPSAAADPPAIPLPHRIAV